MNNEIVLSVVTSTYNRADLVCKNLRRMLGCNSDKLEFIVGDNASDDNTMACLHGIKDSRLHLYHNEENYGVSNIWLLALQARGKYIIPVNDRDYIKPRDLRYLCEKLEEIRCCDCVATGGRLGLEDGYYDGEYIPKFFSYRSHPGRVVYLKEYFMKCITEDVKRSILEGSMSWEFFFRMVCSAQHAYLLNREVITKAKNIEKISRRRKELYSGIFHLDPRSVAEQYIHFYEESVNWSEYLYIEELRLAKYRAYLQDTTYNFYYAMKDEGLKQRYDYTEHSSREWFLNGIRFLVGVLRSNVIKDRKFRVKLIMATVQLYYLAIKPIAIHSFRSSFLKG